MKEDQVKSMSLSIAKLKTLKIVALPLTMCVASWGCAAYCLIGGVLGNITLHPMVLLASILCAVAFASYFAQKFHSKWDEVEEACEDLEEEYAEAEQQEQDAWEAAMMKEVEEDLRIYDESLRSDCK